MISIVQKQTDFTLFLVHFQLAREGRVRTRGLLYIKGLGEEKKRKLEEHLCFGLIAGCHLIMPLFLFKTNLERVLFYFSSPEAGITD